MGMTKAEIAAARRQYRNIEASIEKQVRQCAQIASDKRLSALAELRAEKRELIIKLAAAGVPIKE